jgi:hypothetical protein
MNVSLRHALLVVTLIGAPLVLTGCSVGMALSGEKQPDLAACRVGAERSDIELQLGKPVAGSDLPDGSQSCTYQYQVGNEPSPGRAVVHGAMDVLTLGLWEVVGTPIEAVQGQKYNMTVVYDADGKATQITTQPVK